MNEQIVIHPGELSLTIGNASVATILGSCISFTMLHRESRMAAMCHCLLATRPFGKPSHDGGNRFSYVDGAFAEMLDFFSNKGIRPKDLDVKLFGGADVLKVLGNRRTVGRDNLDSAHRLIAERGIQLKACDIGGQVGRKIIFSTETGNVMVRRLRSAEEQYSAATSESHGIRRHARCRTLQPT